MLKQAIVVELTPRIFPSPIMINIIIIDIHMYLVVEFNGLIGSVAFCTYRLHLLTVTGNRRILILSVVPTSK